MSPAYYPEWSIVTLSLSKRKDNAGTESPICLMVRQAHHDRWEDIPTQLILMIDPYGAKTPLKLL
ncbi:MAG: hypothetical protein RIC30_05040 [Marinoscillum sp.]|uniref:hypothetical protein n=1 Tax=Marinoscillum sp. TaxID=2024838 RepID=UPI0032F09E73